MRAALSVLVALVLSASGCGSNGDEAATTTAPETQPAVEVFGEYERDVTQDDFERTAEKRPEGLEVPPAGTHQLTLSEGTIVVVDPDGFSISQELTVTDGTLEIGATSARAFSALATARHPLRGGSKAKSSPSPQRAIRAPIVIRS